jgi:hypothetical protein
VSRKDENLWLREGADRGKWRDAERARQNRREIQHSLSSGEVSRRDLMKWGLFTTAGLMAPIGGLSPFVRAASAQSSSPGVPTGLPASPAFGVAPFSSPLYRFDILPQFYVPGSQAASNPVPSIPRSTTALSPTPTAQANTTSRWKPNPNDSSCAKPNDLQCTGTAGKRRNQWDALCILGILTQNYASLTDTIRVPDETYFHRPSCILCLRQKARTALYTSPPGADPGSPADKLTVNERLQLLSGAQFPWMCRDGDPLPQDAVRLGRFGKHVLYISKAEKWKLSDFTLFVLTATAQSTAATNSSGSSGQSGKGGLAATAPRGSVIVGGKSFHYLDSQPTPLRR